MLAVNLLRSAPAAWWAGSLRPKAISEPLLALSPPPARDRSHPDRARLGLDHLLARRCKRAGLGLGRHRHALGRIIRNLDWQTVKVNFQPEQNFKTLGAPRPLRDRERELIAFLLRQPFPGRAELREQLGVTRVSAECDDCPTIEFAVDRSASRAPVQSRVPTEAETSSTPREGTTHVLVHVADGYLAEMEFFRFDLKPVRHLPQVSDLRLVDLPPLLDAEDESGTR